MDPSKCLLECTTEINVNVRCIVPGVAGCFALLVQKPSVVRGQDIWFVNPASPIICSHDGNRSGWPRSNTVARKTDNHQNFVCLSETDCSSEEIKKTEMGGAHMGTGKVHRRV